MSIPASRQLKRIIGEIPGVKRFVRPVYRKWFKRQDSPEEFIDSRNYWADRYRSGGSSGDGSYGEFARFKAEVLNAFVRDEGIQSVVEFGCGDGNQLSLADYPSYLGFDVSRDAVKVCRRKFKHDPRYTFKLMENYAGERAELSLSLDVLYHLVEDEIFESYMATLFDSAQRFVVVYSSNTDENPPAQPPHVRHRKFSDWIESRRKDWRLRQHIPNKFPYDEDSKTGTFADFYIFEKTEA